MGILNKKLLAKLIDEVVLPFCKYLSKTKEGKKFLDNDKKRYKHRLETSILAVSLLSKPNFAKEKLQKASVAHNELGIEHSVMRDALNFYFSKIVKFIEKHNLSSSFKNRLKEYEEFFMEVYVPKNLDGDFFYFDSLDVDEAIDYMHYDDKNKISAKEFLAEDTIEKHLISDLEEINEMFDAVSVKKGLVDEEYLKCFENSINSYIYIFNITYEFKNIAYALESLRKFLKFDISTKSEEELKILKSLLDSVIDDLKNWKREVLDKQQAIDIHYLDASLLANVSQIEIMLSNNSQDEEIDFF